MKIYWNIILKYVFFISIIMIKFIIIYNNKNKKLIFFILITLIKIHMLQ